MAKQSKYTQELALPDGNLLLANLLWETFLELSPAEQTEWNLIKQGSQGGSGKLIERLTNSKILISDNFDELQFMRSAYRNNRHSPEVLGLTIAPTIDCNLACVYCYENKRKGRMGPEIENKIREYVDELLPGRKKFNVVWYGGEPLLCKDTVFSLSRYFRNRSDELNAVYSARMTTNAVLLNARVAQEMAEIGGWTNIQVTLDGAAHHHDLRRPAKGGQGTFARIYSNVIQAIEILPISVRMNVDRENVQGCIELLEKFSKDVRPEKVHVYFSPVHLYGKGCRDVAESGEIEILDHETFAYRRHTTRKRYYAAQN